MKHCLVHLVIGLTALFAMPQKEDDEVTVRSLILKSAIMPGLGEFSIGEKRRAKVFGAIELGLWLTFIESAAIKDRSRSRMVSYAAVHANAALVGKGDQFAVDVANYGSLDAFNDEHQRLRLPGRVYSEKDYAWEWESEEHREQYWTYLRARAIAQKVGLFALGGMVLNRIASAIDVSYLARLRDSNVSLHVLPLLNEGSQLILSFSF
ncbi:MAG: hypothetical protein CMG71_07945 [Candidatus Marinimicrobia bacterium]|nr:hypothetical protein [Candidatus Neomarinimicrobiota bacterium]|tara:strand:+ start:487 stop:1110 length:624 start_codon:yes stop_codon:yes gene_type:complete